MTPIHLTDGEWHYDEADPIKAGGFGEVFRGLGSNGPVAVKRLAVAPRGLDERELKIAARFANADMPNVVPVLDYGIDPETDQAFVVMPVCDESLQDYVEREGPLAPAAALSILRKAMEGLQQADAIVHRDIKPGNILRMGKDWLVADFGISKAVEDPTSKDTLRDALSPQYASPEQWRLEKPTQKSDIYALGGVLFFMLTGRPPMSGSIEDLKDGHLHEAFEELPEDTPPALVTFMKRLSRKSAMGRPSLGRAIPMLDKALGQTKGTKASALSSVNALLNTQRTAQEAQTLRSQQEANKRREIGQAGVIQFKELVGDLFSQMREEATEARTLDRSVELGLGELTFWEPNPDYVEVQGWTIAASSYYRVIGRLPPPAPNTVYAYGRRGGYKLCGTLMYAKKDGDHDFRWYEVGFFSPFGQDPEGPVHVTNSDFEIAFSNTMGSLQTSFGPRTIDDEDFDDFCERMMSLFARAAGGTLSSPNQKPIPDSWFLQ